jgi:hypothetical protein
VLNPSGNSEDRMINKTLQNQALILPESIPIMANSICFRSSISHTEIEAQDVPYVGNLMEDMFHFRLETQEHCSQYEWKTELSVLHTPKF